MAGLCLGSNVDSLHRGPSCSKYRQQRHGNSVCAMLHSQPGCTALSASHHRKQLKAFRPGVQHRCGTSRCVRAEAGAAAGTTTASAEELYSELDFSCSEYRRAPQIMKLEESKNVFTAMEALKQAGAVQKWGEVPEKGGLDRRNVFLGELRQVGIKNPEGVAIPSVRNDAAFLYTTVGVTSVIAVAAGFLPGDWGFFVPYLAGGVSIAVLAVGSTAPALLQVITDKFSQVFPDYRQRVLRHEAAHFLTGYLMGAPITGYSLEIGKAHTDFAEGKLGKRLVEQQLADDDIDQLAIMAMAGVSAEAVEYDEVVGQTADLMDLQRILLRSSKKLSDQQQQNMTRWAVFQASALLKRYSREFEALQAAMQQGKSVAECVRAIEQA